MSFTPANPLDNGRVPVEPNDGRPDPPEITTDTYYQKSCGARLSLSIGGPVTQGALYSDDTTQPAIPQTPEQARKDEGTLSAVEPKRFMYDMHPYSLYPYEYSSGQFNTYLPTRYYNYWADLELQFAHTELCAKGTHRAFHAAISNIPDCPHSEPFVSVTDEAYPAVGLLFAENDHTTLVCQGWATFEESPYVFNPEVYPPSIYYVAEHVPLYCYINLIYKYDRAIYKGNKIASFEIHPSIAGGNDTFPAEFGNISFTTVFEAVSTANSVFGFYDDNPVTGISGADNYKGIYLADYLTALPDVSHLFEFDAVASAVTVISDAPMQFVREEFTAHFETELVGTLTVQVYPTGTAAESAITFAESGVYCVFPFIQEINVAEHLIAELPIYHIPRIFSGDINTLELLLDRSFPAVVNMPWYEDSLDALLTLAGFNFGYADSVPCLEVCKDDILIPHDDKIFTFLELGGAGEFDIHQSTSLSWSGDIGEIGYAEDFSISWNIHSLNSGYTVSGEPAKFGVTTYFELEAIEQTIGYIYQNNFYDFIEADSHVMADHPAVFMSFDMFAANFPANTQDIEWSADNFAYPIEYKNDILPQFTGYLEAETLILSASDESGALWGFATPERMAAESIAYVAHYPFWKLRIEGYSELAIGYSTSEIITATHRIYPSMKACEVLPLTDQLLAELGLSTAMSCNRLAAIASVDYTGYPFWRLQINGLPEISIGCSSDYALNGIYLAFRPVIMSHALANWTGHETGTLFNNPNEQIPIFGTLCEDVYAYDSLASATVMADMWAAHVAEDIVHAFVDYFDRGSTYIPASEVTISSNSGERGSASFGLIYNGMVYSDQPFTWGWSKTSIPMTAGFVYKDIHQFNDRYNGNPAHAITGVVGAFFDCRREFAFFNATMQSVGAVLAAVDYNYADNWILWDKSVTHYDTPMDIVVGEVNDFSQPLFYSGIMEVAASATEAPGLKSIFVSGPDTLCIGLSDNYYLSVRSLYPSFSFSAENFAWEASSQHTGFVCMNTLSIPAVKAPSVHAIDAMTHRALSISGYDTLSIGYSGNYGMAASISGIFGIRSETVWEAEQFASLCMLVTGQSFNGVIAPDNAVLTYPMPEILQDIHVATQIAGIFCYPGGYKFDGVVSETSGESKFPADLFAITGSNTLVIGQNGPYTLHFTPTGYDLSHLNLSWIVGQFTGVLEVSVFENGTGTTLDAAGEVVGLMNAEIYGPDILTSGYSTNELISAFGVTAVNPPALSWDAHAILQEIYGFLHVYHRPMPIYGDVLEDNSVQVTSRTILRISGYDILSVGGTLPYDMTALLHENGSPAIFPASAWEVSQHMGCLDLWAYANSVTGNAAPAAVETSDTGIIEILGSDTLPISGTGDYDLREIFIGVIPLAVRKYTYYVAPYGEAGIVSLEAAWTGNAIVSDQSHAVSHEFYFSIFGKDTLTISYSDNQAMRFVGYDISVDQNMFGSIEIVSQNFPTIAQPISAGLNAQLAEIPTAFAQGILKLDGHDTLTIGYADSYNISLFFSISTAADQTYAKILPEVGTAELGNAFVSYHVGTLNENDLAASYVPAWLGIAGSDILAKGGSRPYDILAVSSSRAIPALAQTGYAVTEITTVISSQFASYLKGNLADTIYAVQTGAQFDLTHTGAEVVVQLDGISGCLCHDNFEFPANIVELWAAESNPMAPSGLWPDIVKVYRLDTLGCLYNFQWSALLKARDSIYKNYPQYVENGTVTGLGFADETTTAVLTGHAEFIAKGVKAENIVSIWIDDWYRHDLWMYNWNVQNMRNFHSAYAFDMSIAIMDYHWEIDHAGITADSEIGIQQAFSRDIFEIYGNSSLTVAGTDNYSLILTAYGNSIFGTVASGGYTIQQLDSIAPISLHTEFEGIETSIPTVIESGYGLFINGPDTLTIGYSERELLNFHYKTGGIGAEISDYTYEIIPVEMGRTVLEHRLPMLDATELVVMYAPNPLAYMAINGSDMLSIASSSGYFMFASVFAGYDRINKKFDYVTQIAAPFCLEEHISQSATFWENGVTHTDFWHITDLNISGADTLSIGYDDGYSLLVNSWNRNLEVPVSTPVPQLLGQFFNIIDFVRMDAAIPVPELEKGAIQLSDMTVLGNPELSVGYADQYGLEFFLHKFLPVIPDNSVFEISNLAAGELQHELIAPMQEAVIMAVEGAKSTYGNLIITGADTLSIGHGDSYSLLHNGLNGQFEIQPITVEQISGIAYRPEWSFPAILTEDFIGTSNYAEKNIHFGSEYTYYDSTGVNLVGEFRAIFFWSWGADNIDYNIGHVHVADVHLPVWNIHDIVVVDSTSDAKLWLGFEGIPLYATTDPIITIHDFHTASLQSFIWLEPDLPVIFDIHQILPLTGVQLQDDSVIGTETPPRLLPQLNCDFGTGVEIHDQINEIWFCYSDHIAIPMCGQIEQPNVTEADPRLVPRWYTMEWWERVGNLHAIYGHEYIAMLKLPESVYKGFSGWRWRTTDGIAFADVTEFATLVCRRIQPSFTTLRIEAVDYVHDYNYLDAFVVGWFNRKHYVPTQSFYVGEEIVIEYRNGRIVSHINCETIAQTAIVVPVTFQWPVCIADSNLAYAATEQFMGWAHCAINDLSHNSFYWWADQLQDDSVKVTEEPPRLLPQLNYDFWHGIEIHDQLLGWGCMWYNAHTFFQDPHVGERVWFQAAIQPTIYMSETIATPATDFVAHYEEYKWAVCANTHLSFPVDATFWEGHSTGHLETFAFTWEINIVQQFQPPCSNTHSSVLTPATFWIGYTNDRPDGNSDYNFVWAEYHKFATNYCFESIHCSFMGRLSVDFPIHYDTRFARAIKFHEAVEIHDQIGGYVPHCFCIYELNPTNYRPRPAYAVYGVEVTEEPPRLLPQLNWDFKHAVEISAYDTIHLAWRPPCQMHEPYFMAYHLDWLGITEEPPRLNPQLNWDFWHGIEIHEQEMAKWVFAPFKSEFTGPILDAIHVSMGDVLVPQLNWNFKTAYVVEPVLTAERPDPQLNWHCNMWADALNAVYWVGPRPDLVFIPMIPELDFWFDFAEDSRFTMSFIF